MTQQLVIMVHIRTTGSQKLMYCIVFLIQYTRHHRANNRRRRRRHLIRPSNSIRTSINQGQGRGSILLPPRAAALPRLDAGSGSVKPTSSCVIQNLQTSYSFWYMLYEKYRYDLICC